MYYNKLLSSSTNKSETSWNIINPLNAELNPIYHLLALLGAHPILHISRIGVNNETDTASSKKFTQTEFKLGNKIIGTNQSAKIFNNYIINSVDELITWQPKIESALFSHRESFPYEFPHIINIPVADAEVICAISSLKNKTSCGYGGLSNKILKLCSSQISKPSKFSINR